MYRRFEGTVIFLCTDGCAQSLLSWVSHFGFSSQSYHSSDFEKQAVGTFTLPLVWIIAAVLTSIPFVLVRQRRSGGLDGTLASFTTPRGPVLNDLPHTLEVLHAEGLSLSVASYAPTVCAGECFEEEFWRSLQDG